MLTTFKVQVRGGTVTRSDKNFLTIMTSDKLIYQIDLISNKQFSGLKFQEGDIVWILCVPQRFRVLTVVDARECLERPEDVDKEVQLE
jgi:hypothetical protein